MRWQAQGSHEMCAGRRSASALKSLTNACAVALQVVLPITAPGDPTLSQCPFRYTMTSRSSSVALAADNINEEGIAGGLKQLE